MQFYSTNNPAQRFPLKTAVIKGLPDDNGLFMPEELPRLPESFFAALPGLSFPELSFEVAKALLGDSVPPADLRELVENALSFDAPLVPLNADKAVLELFHGPTLAFKDFGARFMAQLMSWLIRHDRQELHILVATSGDTGGAVAAGFFQTPGIRVTILYPSGKVSGLQEKQLTTLGHNIEALEIDGTFDDCQTLVKQAFLDPDLQRELRLTSANSINIARLIPQSFYYFRAWQQRPDPARPVAFCVPSGNFGNLTAGLFAWRLGLPVQRFIAATNANDVVPEYLETSVFRPRPSVATLSNAMDVGNPSNFARMLDLAGPEAHERLRQDLAGYRYTDAETHAAMRQVFDRHGYVMDPHGAVGYLALEAWQQENPGSYGILLETAHPAKFPEAVEAAIGQPVEIPERLARLREREKVATKLGTDFVGFKEWLMG